MKSMSLKNKMLLMLFPVVILALLLGLKVLHQLFTEKDAATSVMQSARAQISLSSLIHELQKERGMSALYSGKKITIDDLRGQHRKADIILQTYRSQLKDVDFKNLNDEIETFNRHLEEARNSVLSPYEGGMPFALYSKAISHAIRTQIKLYENAHFKGTESRFISLAIFEESKENMGKLRARLNATFGSDQKREIAERDEYARYLTAILINLESPGLLISDSARIATLNTLSSKEWKEVLQSYRIFSEKYATGGYGIDAKDFFDKITTRIDAVYAVIKSEQDANLKFLSDVIDDVNRQFFILATLILLMMTIAFIVAFKTINKLVSDLQTTSEILNKASGDLTSVSTQIASSSGELANAATEQAASLEETAASIDEMNSMVQKNAETAVQTSELAKKSTTSAEEGKQVVRDMIKAINEISDSSNNILLRVNESNKELMNIVKVISAIGEKTVVINDIVRQTRLLSFNASVEAAQAGEEGKGFAVVAAEVGGLAKMSGVAAEEISVMLDDSLRKVEGIVASTTEQVNKLIQDSKIKVEKGVAVANKCGKVLDVIVENVSDVTRMADSISTASQEQAKGVQEITKAINQLDVVTQSNAATSEESASSSEELATQAASLQEAVKGLVKTITG